MDHYMISASGRRIDVPDPLPAQIDIQDIATHLSRLPRYVGASRRFLSVAQHSVCVAYMSVSVANEYLNDPSMPTVSLAHDKQNALIREGLLHDAAEYITGDCPSPVKWCIGKVAHANAYKQVSNSIERAIRSRFDLERHEPSDVAVADKIMLKLESEELVAGKLDLQYIFPLALNTIPKLQNSGCPWYTQAVEVMRENWDEHTARKAFLREWACANGEAPEMYLNGVIL